MKKVFILIIGVLTLLSSCQNKEQTIKIGYLPILLSSQLYVGIVEGYFKEEGIKVEISEIYNGPDIVTAIRGKSIDIGVAITPPLILARANGVKIKSIGGATYDGEPVQEHRLMLPIDSKIQIAQDLKGKKIAVVAEGTSDYFSLLNYLKTNGIRKEEVEIISVPHPEMIFALTSKAVDAAAGVEPFITMGALEKKTRTFDFYYPLQILEVGTFLAHEDFINANPELVAKITRAIDKATTLIQNEKEFRQLLPTFEQHGIKFKVRKEVADSTRIMGFRNRLDPVSLEAVMDMLIDNNVLKERINIEECIYSPK
jgi:NitT/TauT family transport system substrate-binding protein